MIFDILETKLAAVGFQAGRPQNGLFRYTMPADVVTGVMLRTPLDGVKVNPHMTGFYTAEIQAIVRHFDPVEGMAMAQRVVEALKVEVREDYPPSVERGPAHITHCWPCDLPILFPRLEGNGYEISVHMRTSFGFQVLSA